MLSVNRDPQPACKVRFIPIRDEGVFSHGDLC